VAHLSCHVSHTLHSFPWRSQQTGLVWLSCHVIRAGFLTYSRTTQAHQNEAFLQETRLLQTIDGLKQRATQENREVRINKMLRTFAQPKCWDLANGKKIQVHTPLTTRARELMQLYQGLQLPLLSMEERLDVLLHVKWTVKEFDCQLTREIVDLVRPPCFVSPGIVSHMACLQSCEPCFNQLCTTTKFHYFRPHITGATWCLSPTTCSSRPWHMPPRHEQRRRLPWQPTRPIFRVPFVRPFSRCATQQSENFVDLTPASARLQIDREADLLNRGRAIRTLSGVRKRISNLFLAFIETPEFNPEAASIQSVPQDSAAFVLQTSRPGNLRAAVAV
jgi:hypothetical protein